MAPGRNVILPLIKDLEKISDKQESYNAEAQPV
jgi:hypothetical protein